MNKTPYQIQLFKYFQPQQNKFKISLHNEGLLKNLADLRKFVFVVFAFFTESFSLVNLGRKKPEAEKKVESNIRAFSEFRMDLDLQSNESFFSSFLRIGLFFGAIFQIACIGFVIFDNEHQDDDRVCIDSFLVVSENNLLILFRTPIVTLHQPTGVRSVAKTTKRREDSLIVLKNLLEYE